MYSLVRDTKDGRLYFKGNSLVADVWVKKDGFFTVFRSVEEANEVASRRGGRVIKWIEAPTEPEPEPPAFAK